MAEDDRGGRLIVDLAVTYKRGVPTDLGNTFKIGASTDLDNTFKRDPKPGELGTRLISVSDLDNTVVVNTFKRDPTDLDNTFKRDLTDLDNTFRRDSTDLDNTVKRDPKEDDRGARLLSDLDNTFSQFSRDPKGAQLLSDLDNTFKRDPMGDRGARLLSDLDNTLKRDPTEDDRGARLLSDLNNIFKKDPNIDEYDMLPVLEPSHNRSPFLLQDHKLGVESWAVKILVRYSAQRLNRWRARRSGEQLTDLLKVCHLSRAVLLFSPEVYTAWNIRKELIEHGCLSLSEDLAFGALVLSKHPNSSETYVHRRWLFRQLMDHCLSSSSASSSSCSTSASENILLNVDTIDVDVGVFAPTGVRENGALALESSRLMRSHTQRELSLCGRASDSYACNYHAWSHRIWVMQHCLNSSLEAVLSELAVTESWMARHISDHSGFHYRQFLLSELHSKHNELASVCLHNSTELLLLEMAQICSLIHSFPGHETLWYHRRFIFQTLLKSDHHEVKLQKHFSNGHVLVPEKTLPRDAKSLKSFYISQEIENVTSKDLSDSHSYQQTLIQNYVHWLQTL